MMHPYAEGNIAAARRDIAKCIAALRAACKAKDAEAWEQMGKALYLASHVEAHLADAMLLDEMATTTGNEEESAA